MPTLTYRARALTGEIVEGQQRAKNEQALRMSLSRGGLEVLSVLQVTEASVAARSASPWDRFLKPVRGRDLRWLTGQIALMLETGTTVAEALEALAEQTAGKRLSTVMSEVHRSVIGGLALSAALEEHPEVFSNFYVSAVKAGEGSGTLADVFARIEAHLKKREDLIQTIRLAMTYPLILTALAIAAVIFMMTFVLPKFLVVFGSFGAELPLPTRMLMSTADFVRRYWFALPLAIFGPPAAAYAYFTSSPGKPVLDRLMLRLPILGPMTRVIQSSLMFRTLGTLLNAGVPVVESMAVAEQSCNNGVFKKTVSRITSGILRGEGFAANFSKSELFSPSVKQMVATGEQTGSMALVMTKLADHFDEEANTRLTRLGTLVEPLIIIIMGVVIGFIAISLLFPLFKLSSAVRGGV